MISCRCLTLAFFLSSVFVFAGTSFAQSETSTIAFKGRPAYVYPNWPEGVGELVNDASRSSGWNSWFSEWPSDVNHYAFEIKSTNDLNRSITKLAAVKTELRQIRLSHLKEPGGLGWVTRIPEGNGIPVIFSIGDQSVIDQWYERVRNPFGKIEFTAAPVAVPPTLTIFVRNESVKLDDLKIPERIDVSMGYVPTLFHKSNIKIEKKPQKQGENQDGDREAEAFKEGLDETSRAAVKEIESFLESRKRGKVR